MPGYSPDFNADEAIWGWATPVAICYSGEQGGGARQIPGRAVQPERRGETALPDGDPAPIPSTRQMHIPPWLWFSITTTVQLAR